MIKQFVEKHPTLSVAAFIVSFALLCQVVQYAVLSHRIDTVNHKLVASQKAATHSRPTTVEQRCQLTNEVLAVVQLNVKVLNPFLPKAAGLYLPHEERLVRYYAACEKSLVQVKKIDHNTPSP